MSNQQDDNMMHLSYVVSGTDFTRAGEASGDVKRKLKTMGADPGAVRKVSIAMYEGEINMVIHAHGGIIGERTLAVFGIADFGHHEMLAEHRGALSGNAPGYSAICQSHGR